MDYIYNTFENSGIDRIPYDNGQIIINVSIDTKMNPGTIKFPLVYEYVPIPSCDPTSKLLVAFNTRTQNHSAHTITTG